MHLVRPFLCGNGGVKRLLNGLFGNKEGEKIKKLLATVLLSSSFALCSCDPSMKVGGGIVYGIRSDQSVEQISVSYYDEENDKNHYVLAGYGYENFRIEYCIAPGEQNPTPVNIGTISFYC